MLLLSFILPMHTSILSLANCEKGLPREPLGWISDYYQVKGRIYPYTQDTLFLE